MIKVSIIALGKLKEKYWRDTVDEYSKRISGYSGFEIIELNPERLPDNPNAAQIETALSNEAAQIIKKIPKGSKVVTLCIEGKAVDSEFLSEYICNAALTGCSHITFIIGSSFGLHESVKKLSDLRLSFSKMTFPHQLARVMLCEQVYRAFKIGEGSAYHK